MGLIIFLMDFIKFEYDAYLKVSFILRHLFQANGRALIDVTIGLLAMKAHNKVQVFDGYKAMKLPYIYEELFVIMVIDIESKLLLFTFKDTLQQHFGRA